MDERRYNELKQLLETTVSQSETRLMAHVGSIEQKLHDLEQQASGTQSHMDSRANELRGEFERIRYSIEQLGSHFR